MKSNTCSLFPVTRALIESLVVALLVKPIVQTTSIGRLSANVGSGSRFLVRPDSLCVCDLACIDGVDIINCNVFTKELWDLFQWEILRLP